MRILMIANGQCADYKRLRDTARASDYILALDGGADTALAAGIMPDLALGDFDSITAAAKRRLGPLRLLQIARQDNIDLEKGLDFAAFLRARSVTVACATGGRVDFTIGNLSSAFAYVKKMDIVFESDNCRIYPLQKPARFCCKKGARVSLLPMGACAGITLRNLKYPLKNAALAPGQTAVSNVALKDNFEVALKKGNLLVVVYD